jgi:lipopolysaccharide/colanic/teichoic acid biosynthesis glycosyltransferase
VKRRGLTSSIESKITLSNYVISVFAGLSQHILLEEVFLATNWAFLGNGNVTLSILTVLICFMLFGGRKFSSIFLFMSGLEHYAYIVRRSFVLISLLVFMIFILSLPGGRNFIFVCLVWQTSLWLFARKVLSIWVRRRIRALKLAIISEKQFLSDFFSKNFDDVQVSKELSLESHVIKSADIVLFHNFSRFDLDHFVTIAKLQNEGITSGYISNEIRIQGWSGIQVLVGPHLMMINNSYINSFTIRIWKRLFDLLCTAVILIVLLPFLAIVTMLLFALNGRPILFSQERVGVKGLNFRILKYRTLKRKLVNDKLFVAGEGDWVRKPHKDELVRLGGWMRRWSIDEFPQLMNVLLGQMSLVGPRPRLSNETDEAYKITSPLFAMGLKPGITGLWQISGRNEIDPQFALVLDKYYVDHWNPLMDLQILIKTLAAIRRGIGAK